MRILKSEEVGATGHSMLLSGTESISLIICPASHAYVYYAMVARQKLAELLYLEEVHILALSVIAGYVYLQHG